MPTSDHARIVPVVQRVDLRERYLTAAHEAGHAVAAVLRGGTFDSISITPTVGRDGLIRTRGVKACDFPFVSSPDRGRRLVDWGVLPLDGVDAREHTFVDYLRASMRSNASDLREYVPEQDLPFELWCADFGWDDDVPEIPLAQNQSWCVELETCWPTIQWMAEMLMDEVDVTPEALAKSRKELPRLNEC